MKCLQFSDRDKADTILNSSQISGGCIIQEVMNISWAESRH